MAKFEVGDKVRIIQGSYPQDYYHPRIALRHEFLNRIGKVVSWYAEYPEGYLPDYRVMFEDGDFEQFDEVHLKLVEEEPEGKIPTSADVLEEILVLLRSNDERLAAIEERLAAHEEARHKPYVVNLMATILP